MKQIKIKMAARFSFPADVVTQTLGILGKRGSGKTTTASRLAEQLLEHKLPVVIIDPTGAWWGLRSSLDGSSEGYPITVLGGDHGDLPLEETAGALIAEMVAESAPPLVLDLSGLSKGGARRFVQNFAEQLYRKNRTALHVILDEADEFAPQRLFKDALPVFGAVDTLVRRGRIRGIGITMVSQRSAAINKDILSQCEVLIAHRASHPTDLEPILEWMKVHARERIQEVHDSIAKLAAGEAWVMSPEWLDFFGRVQMLNRTTFNSSATPAPGQRRAEPKRLAAVDLERLQHQMAATIERARAADPKALRARIGKLEEDLAHARAKAEAPAVAPAKIKTKVVEKRVLRPGEVDRLQALVKQTVAVAEKMLNVAERISLPLEAYTKNVDRPLEAADRPLARSLKSPLPPERGFSALPKPVPTVDCELRAGERRMLQTLARSHPVARTRAQLGTLSGFTPSGGTFSTYFGTLKRLGLIAERNGMVEITALGLEVTGQAAQAPLTREETLQMWRQALRAGERKMLDYLIRVYPLSSKKEELGKETGFTHTGGTFSTYLGVLRRNGLAEVRGNEVSAAAVLFES